MTQEIKVYYKPTEDSLTVVWLFHGDKATIDFSVRCPTKNWNYYLAVNLGYHADAAQYDGQALMQTCDYRPNKQCYCDGTSLGAEDLWKMYCKTGNEEVIWNKLESIMSDRFP